jgi:hypothetical protein
MDRTRRSPAGWLLSFPVLVTGLLALVCLYLARTTWDLRWPYDVDLFRDIGQAQAVRDGNLFGDANYRGELAWYNPLGTWIVAALSAITGADVATVATRGGVLLNLLSPIALTVLVRRWFGRAAGGFALVAYIFLVCANYPSWAVATYSPWLFQANFAQGLFYLALLAVPPAFERPEMRWAILLGASAGLVALAHTAPALILVVVCAAVGVFEVRWRDVPLGATVRRAAVAAATALLVAAPFLVPIAVRYHFEIRNELPSGWVWDEIRWAHLPRFAWDFGWRWPVLLGAASVLIWLFRRRDGVPPVVGVALGAWTGASLVALVLATYAGSGHAGSGLVPTIVPSYHYLLYLTAAGCVWFGIAVASLVRELTERRIVPLSHAATCAAIAVVMIIGAAHGWRGRDERTAARATSIAIADLFQDFAVSEWLAGATGTDDVVLYDLDPTQAVDVGALDRRRTVVVDEFFSNPYVDRAPRAEAAQTMLNALRACDLWRFDDLAQRYSVRYVVTSTGGELSLLVERCPGLTAAYRDQYATVVAVEHVT